MIIGVLSGLALLHPFAAPKLQIRSANWRINMMALHLKVIYTNFVISRSGKTISTGIV